MLEIMLFVISAVGCVMFITQIATTMSGHELARPFPIFYRFGLTFSDTHVVTLSLGYQLYFWADYFSLFN